MGREQAGWPNTRICRQELVAEIERMETDSDVPSRTMGSLSLSRLLTGGGLVDRVDDLPPDRRGFRA